MKAGPFIDTQRVLRKVLIEGHPTRRAEVWEDWVEFWPISAKELGQHTWVSRLLGWETKDGKERAHGTTFVSSGS